MKEKLRNHAFIGLFATYLIITLIVEMSLFAYTFGSEINRSQEQTEQVNQDAMENVSNHLARLVQDEIALGEKVRTTSWVIKLGAKDNVFDSQFDWMKRQEIKENFLFNVSVGSAVYSRAVLFESQEIAVGKGFWCKPQVYLNKQGVPLEKQNEFLADILHLTEAKQLECTNQYGGSCFGKNIFFVTPLNPKANITSRIFMCTIFNTANILSDIQPMLPSSIAGFQVHNAETGTVILNWSQPGSEEQWTTFTQPIPGTGWIASFDVIDSMVYISQDVMANNFGAYLGVLVLGAALSFFLANVTYRPVQQLLNKLVPNASEKNAYRAISNSIDSMVTRLEESRKADAMRQLLAGYFGMTEESKQDIPFQDSMLVRVFLLMATENDPVPYSMLEELQRLLVQGSVCVEWSESLNRTLVLVLGANQEQALHDASARVFTFLDAQGWKGHIFAGEPAKGLIGVSLSYQAAQEKQHYLLNCRSFRYYFPFDWETQLLQALRQGQQNVALEIFHELKAENENRLSKEEMVHADALQLLNHVISDLRRCVQESSADEALLSPLNQLNALSTMEEMWHTLTGVVLEICRSVQTRQEGKTDMDQRIVQYIDDHYCQADMSITLLQEQFGVSANTINKSIRQVTGQTFSPYLIKCRMDRAKQLLEDSSLKIPVIAQMVGYENDYSFRRTFLRYAGCKAQEYRDFLLSAPPDSPS